MHQLKKMRKEKLPIRWNEFKSAIQVNTWVVLFWITLITPVQKSGKIKTLAQHSFNNELVFIL